MTKLQTYEAKFLQSASSSLDDLLQMYLKVGQLLEDHSEVMLGTLPKDILALKGELKDAIHRKLAQFPRELYPTEFLGMTSVKVVEIREHEKRRREFVRRTKDEIAKTKGRPTRSPYVETLAR